MLPSPINAAQQFLCKLNPSFKWNNMLAKALIKDSHLLIFLQKSCLSKLHVQAMNTKSVTKKQWLVIQGRKKKECTVFTSSTYFSLTSNILSRIVHDEQKWQTQCPKYSMVLWILIIINFTMSQQLNQWYFCRGSFSLNTFPFIRGLSHFY